MATGSLKYPKRVRLGGKRAFGLVYEEGVGESRGPLKVIGRANDLQISRLGLSVSRRVGTAVVRNRIKRLLRESFRLMRSDLPIGYDFVVVVRPHVPLPLAEYQRLLKAGATRVVSRISRR